MAQDHYEVLQVHQRADQEALRAAYERLRVMYDPVRLEGAAEELILLARTKLAAIEAAYATLSDSEKRAEYDRLIAAGLPAAILGGATTAEPVQVEVLDYRPLPPAEKSERPRQFSHEPVETRTPPARPKPVVLGGMLFGLIIAVALVSLLITNWDGITSPPKTTTGPTATPSALDQYDIAISQARQVTEQSPNDPQAWIALGNQLYDSVQVIHENMPDSPLYKQRISRWLEASQAYDRALALQPNNPSVQADKGTSLCFYGVGASDQRFVNQGILLVRDAANQRPDDPLIQLNMGNCLVSSQPPQTADAIVAWQKVLKITPADSVLAQRANELIQQYQKK